MKEKEGQRKEGENVRAREREKHTVETYTFSQEQSPSLHRGGVHLSHWHNELGSKPRAVLKQ